MKTVLLRAPLLSQSGYGVHARQIARAVFAMQKELGFKLSTSIYSWGGTHQITDYYACDGLIADIVDASVPTVTADSAYDVSLQLMLPEWDASVAKVNIGFTAAVETDVCNPRWLEAVNRMNLVVVPSEFTKGVFLNSAQRLGYPLTTPIVVVPESFPAVYLEKPTAHRLQLGTAFNFLAVAQLNGSTPDTDRKNLLMTLKWFLEEFKGKSECGLVIKTSTTGALTEYDRTLTTNNFNAVMRDLQAAGIYAPGPKSPSIYLLHGRMTDNEMYSLYTHPKIKAMLALTRGEGFGLPMLEAAACDLPVIFTDWSAHTEFLKKHPRNLAVPCSLIRVADAKVDNNIFFAGAKWAEPDEKQAKLRMKKFTEAPSTPQQWSKELGKTLRAEYSPAAIDARYAEVLKEYLQ